MTKFIYIDDDPESYYKIQGFENEKLTIESQQHKDSWEEQLQSIKNKEDEIDGIILDLKLDDLPNLNGHRAKFRGTSLAQEIRTRQKEGILKSFPIVLFSANDKVSLALEKSGKDLFDICIDKSNINSESFAIYTPQLLTLASGYKKLLKTKDIKESLNSDISFIDSRFLSELEDYQSSPVHVQARFIITELLDKQGLLINEDVLAARLGIDKTSSPDWELLKQSLSTAQYTGVFYEGWPKWWMHLVDRWWTEKIEVNLSLHSTPASKKVEQIRAKLNFDKLEVAQRIDKSVSDEFWTICKGYNRPLDPVDGLIIQGQDNLYPWQEPEYVSIDAALKKKNIENWGQVADVEKEYLEELKVVFRPKK